MAADNAPAGVRRDRNDTGFDGIIRYFRRDRKEAVVARHQDAACSRVGQHVAVDATACPRARGIDRMKSACVKINRSIIGQIILMALKAQGIVFRTLGEGVGEVHVVACAAGGDLELAMDAHRRTRYFGRMAFGARFSVLRAVQGKPLLRIKGKAARAVNVVAVYARGGLSRRVPGFQESIKIRLMTIGAIGDTLQEAERVRVIDKQPSTARIGHMGAAGPVARFAVHEEVRAFEKLGLVGSAKPVMTGHAGRRTHFALGSTAIPIRTHKEDKNSAK